MTDNEIAPKMISCAIAAYVDKFLMTKTSVPIEKVVAITEAIRARTDEDAAADQWGGWAMKERKTDGRAC